MTKGRIAFFATTMAVSAAGGALLCRYLLERPALPEGVVLSTLTSSILGEEREVIVHLPETYGREPERKYPVIYVLDGSSQDIHTASTAALMARIGVMPELIVVGLPNVSGRGRQRDYTPPFMAQDLDEEASPMGGADRFLAFLKTELVPTIERDYRTLDTRMLAGHSRGGLFVVYSLVADAGLFAARFAHSPALWRDDGIMLEKLSGFLSTTRGLDTFLYLSVGSEENQDMRACFQNAASILRERDVPGLLWQADVVRGADHRRNGEAATPLGFRELYREWAAQ